MNINTSNFFTNSKNKNGNKNFFSRLIIVLIILATTTNQVLSQIQTIAAGSYSSASTWLGGVVPSESSTVIIKHAVSLTSASVGVSKITIASGGSLTISSTGALVASTSITVSGGSLIFTGGTVNVGTSGGGNKIFTLTTGTLKISSGVFNVNGNLVMNGGTFTMSGGNLKIDPNTGSSSRSVASGIDIFKLSSAVKTTVNGGTITFVDPPYTGTGKTFTYTGTTRDASWIGNTMIFGGSTGKNTAAGGTNGFNIDTRADGEGGSYIKLGNVILNGGSGTNRFVSGAAIGSHGFDIGGDLTINSGGEGRTLAGGAVLRIQGDIYNKGKFVDYAGVVFGGRTAPNTAAQYVTNYNGTGVFWNNTDMYKANAHFTNLEFNNTAKPKAVTFNFGDGIVVDGAVGVSHKVDFINGAVEIGPDNQFVMRKTCSSKRVNGFLLRGGAGQLCKEFPLGASTFTYHIADTTNNYDYAPVTISLTANDFDARIITISQKDVVHPKIKTGATPTDYISRFWQVVCTSPGTFTGNVTCNYLSEDIVGSESNLKFSNWDGAKWNENNTIRSSNKITVKINQSTWGRSSICEITGRACNSTTTAATTTARIASTNNEIPGATLNASIVNESAKQISQQAVGKVTVYPNPVTGGKVNLKFNSLPVGKYNVSIYNTNGQQVYTGSINYGGGSLSQSIQLSHNPAGIYKLLIKNGQEPISIQSLFLQN